MIEESGPESIEDGPISARKKEIINVSSQEDVMTIYSSFPHTFLITNFRAALLFKERAHIGTKRGPHLAYHKEA